MSNLYRVIALPSGARKTPPIHLDEGANLIKVIQLLSLSLKFQAIFFWKSPRSLFAYISIIISIYKVYKPHHILSLSL